MTNTDKLTGEYKMTAREISDRAFRDCFPGWDANCSYRFSVSQSYKDEINEIFNQYLLDNNIKLEKP